MSLQNGHAHPSGINDSSGSSSRQTMSLQNGNGHPSGINDSSGSNGVLEESMLNSSPSNGGSNVDLDVNVSSNSGDEEPDHLSDVLNRFFIDLQEVLYEEADPEGHDFHYESEGADSSYADAGGSNDSFGSDHGASNGAVEYMPNGFMHAVHISHHGASNGAVDYMTNGFMHAVQISHDGSLPNGNGAHHTESVLSSDSEGEGGSEVS